MQKPWKPSISTHIGYPSKCVSYTVNICNKKQNRRKNISIQCTITATSYLSQGCWKNNQKFCIFEFDHHWSWTKSVVGLWYRKQNVESLCTGTRIEFPFLPYSKPIQSSTYIDYQVLQFHRSASTKNQTIIVTILGEMLSFIHCEWPVPEKRISIVFAFIERVSLFVFYFLHFFLSFFLILRCCWLWYVIVMCVYI